MVSIVSRGRRRAGPRANAFALAPVVTATRPTGDVCRFDVQLPHTFSDEVGPT